MWPYLKSIRYFAVPFLLALSLILTIGWFADNKQKQKNLDSIAHDQQEVLQLRISLFEDFMSPLISDLFYLANLPDLQKTESFTGETEKLVEQFFYFSKANNYSQIRVLDTLGMEKIRVDFKDDKPIVIPDTSLQDKSLRMYFKESISLDKNQLYISRLDLNMERGKIELPEQPVIRLGTPIYTHEGKKKGLLIINCNVSDFLNKLDTIGIRSNAFSFGLLNENGYWLSRGWHQPFGFQIDSLHGETAASLYPNMWKSISDSTFGKVLTSKGFFIYHKLLMSKVLSDLNLSNKTGFSLSKDREYLFLIHASHDAIHERLAAHRPVLFGIVLVMVIALLAVWAAFIKTKERSKDARLKVLLKKAQEQTEQLQEKNEHLESFVRIVSHDLREPLATIQSITQLVAEYKCKPMDTDFEEYTNFILACVDRMDKLTLGILDYAITGKDSVLSLISVNKLVGNIELDLKESIDRTGAHILYSRLPVLYAYEMELVQLFQNLIANAIKYRRDDAAPIIQIEFKENKDHYLFSISDNGIGIDEKDQEKVFNLFSRLKKKKHEKGLGIGLAITKKIVELHQGTIWISGNERGGTTFWFIISKLRPHTSDFSSSTVISGKIPTLPG